MTEHSHINMPPPIRATLLGSARISVGDRLLGDDVWSLRSARSLFLLLLISPNHSMPKERVLDVLWPESNPDVARNALYKALHHLRRVLEPDLTKASKSAYIESRGSSIGISPDVDVRVDADECQAALQQATTASPELRRNLLRDAVHLYGGTLLPSDPYEDWPVARREALRFAWENAVLDLAGLDLKANEPQVSVSSLEQLLADDPLNEAAHRALMRGYLAAGQRDRAIRQYERCVAALESELGVEPDAETSALHDEIRASTPEDEIQPKPRSGPFNNLPSPPTEIVGRDREVESLTRILWRQNVRLMTLVGPGGVGKSRLAVEVATHLVEDFVDGVAFVPLAAERDAGLVLQAIARTLGLSEEPNTPISETLTHYLREREMLLVLDNFEQVVDAATDIGHLLANCASVTVLATSRERLQLRGEHLHEVPPLTVPRPDRLPSPAMLARYGSVVLFSQQIQRFDPDFHVTPGNSEVVSAICSHLEGLPLAIELATARARFYTLDNLLRRLESRLDIEQGPRDLPDRHQTLRSTVAWSYDLLSDDERAIFRRLGLAIGGYTSEAAEIIGSAGNVQAQELLHSLAEKHLIQWEKTDEGPRITMLEVIREFALERLQDSGDEADTRERHAAYFLDLVMQAEQHLGGADLLSWFDRLEVEQGNIRSSLEWAIEQQDSFGTRAVQAVVALWSFWLRRGSNKEGINWLERAAAAQATDPRLRTQVLLSLAQMREAQSDYERAEALIGEALPISQQIGDQAGIAKALTGLGEIAEDRGDLQRASALHRQALAIYQEAGLRRESTRSLNNIATVAYYQGEFESAANLWDEALGIVRESEDEWAASVLLGNLGAVAMAAGDFERAVSLHEENLAIARHLRDPGTIGRSLCNLAEAKQFLGAGDQDNILNEALTLNRETQDKHCEISTLTLMGNSALGRGEFRQAACMYAQSLSLCETVGERATMANIALLERIAQLAFSSGQPIHAARLLGGSEALRNELGAPIMPYLRPIRDRCLAAIKDRVDASAMDAAIAQGQSWQPHVAIQEARSVCEIAHTGVSVFGQRSPDLDPACLLHESNH